MDDKRLKNVGHRENILHDLDNLTVKQAKELLDKYPDDAKFDYDSGGIYDSPSLDLVWVADETDKEYAIRVKRLEWQEKLLNTMRKEAEIAKEKRDKKEYERLRAKYEK